MKHYCSSSLLLIIVLLSSFSFLAAQDESIDLPDIAYIQENSLYVFEPSTGVTQLVNEENRDVFTIFHRAFWSPDGTWLAYLAPYPEDSNSSVLTINNLQGTRIGLTITDFATPFYPKWLEDGRILYATYSGERREFAAILNAYTILPEEGADPVLLGQFEVIEGCGGGTNNPAESDYFLETSLGGYREAFMLTDYGLVHDGQCVGSEVTLTNLETGEATALAGGGVVKAMLSPDGNSVIGIKEGQLLLVNLADMSAVTISTSASPDQYIWADNETIFYSSYEVIGDLLEPFSDAEIENIRTNLGYLPELMPRREVSLYRLNLATGEDDLLYTADAFAIGRIAVRDNWLIFSQVANPDAWMAALANNIITLSTDYALIEDISHVEIFTLNLETGQVVKLLDDAQQMVVAP